MHRQSAFSLIELLVIISIIGILAALAIPQYASYRKRAYDVEAEQALSEVATAEEAYYNDFETYKACDNGGCSAILPNSRTIDAQVELHITVTGETFAATGRHLKGTGKVFTRP